MSSDKDDTTNSTNYGEQTPTSTQKGYTQQQTFKCTY